MRWLERLGFVVVVVLIIVLGFAVAVSAEEPTCHEDEDCWDCETMGNQVCGPVGGVWVQEPVLVVDGSVYYPSKISGDTVHFETPDVDPFWAYSWRHTWAGNGSENLPCEGGIHWIDNENVLTVSHCLVPTTTTSTSTSTTTSTTTTVPVSTTTTVPETTTTSSSTTTTDPSTTTTVPSSTTTRPPVSTSSTSVPVTTTTAPPELPKTGLPLVLLSIIGIGAVTLGVLALAGTKRDD